MSDIQRLVQEAVDELVGSGAEVGLQVAVFRDGEQVADAVAGVADSTTGREVTSATPFWSASTLKGATATVAHVLVERGALDYDTPIVELWPEFGAHGKDGATVRHALTHSIGAVALPADTTPEGLTDWDAVCTAIAESEPWWQPGTGTGYHPQTFGFIVGEIVRRATGKRISEVLRDEVAGPLGVADELFFGVPESELARLARLETPPGIPALSDVMPPDFPMIKAVPSAVMPNADFGNRTDVLTADIPAGGATTARAIARMYAALLGEVDGVRLVSPQRLREISTIATSGMDQMTFSPASWALGFSVGRPDSSPEESPTVFGMQGMGGSAAYADTATGVSVAVTKTVFNPLEASAVARIDEVVTKALAG